MSKNSVTKETLRKKYVKKIEQDLDKLKKNQIQSPGNITFDEKKEIRFTLELIKYLTAELANTKAELWLLKQSTKEPHH